eukprot:Gb_01559 [translate_table: standard]
MAKPSGRAGAWAADVEREAEEKIKNAAMSVAGESESFPSLMEAVSSKPKKKNKGQTLSLSELQSGKHVGPGGRSRGLPEAKGLTTEEMMILPTGPRDRTGEEPEYGGLGGGFRDYGRNSRGGGFENRDRDRGFGGGFSRDRDEGRKSYGGFEEDRRQPRGGIDRDQPSRADEADNWGSKKVLPPPPSDSFERRRYDDRGDRFEGGGAPVSRADEVDNWGTGKKFVQSVAPPDRRSMGFGSSYRDPTSDSERWGRRESFRDSSRDDTRPTDRSRLVLNPPGTVSAPVVNPAVEGDASRAPRPSPFGSARPREAVLAEKGQDWKKLESEIEARDDSRHSSRPTSAHSSRPGSPNLQSELVPKPRPKINPFGDAKPREVLLAEKGKDYRKMDFELEHRRVGRHETEEEIKLKEEINALNDRAKQISDDQVTGNGKASDEENQPTLSETIMKKEKQLELLIRDLDDKFRLAQRSGDRPGSAVGRPFESFERPGSQSGRSDSGRNYDSFERPKSRGGEGGGADIWRSGEERRGIYGNRDRGFNNRDRSESRNRW